MVIMSNKVYSTDEAINMDLMVAMRNKDILHSRWLGVWANSTRFALCFSHGWLIITEDGRIHVFITEDRRTCFHYARHIFRALVVEIFDIGLICRSVMGKKQLPSLESTPFPLWIAVEQFIIQINPGSSGQFALNYGKIKHSSNGERANVKERLWSNCARRSRWTR